MFVKRQIALFATDQWFRAGRHAIEIVNQIQNIKQVDATVSISVAGLQRIRRRAGRHAIEIVDEKKQVEQIDIPVAVGIAESPGAKRQRVGADGRSAGVVGGFHPPPVGGIIQQSIGQLISDSPDTVPLSSM